MIVDIVLVVVAAVLWSLVTYVVIRISVYLFASLDKLFTFRVEDQFKYHMIREELHEILFKSRTHVVDQLTGDVTPMAGAPDTQQTWSERWLGARWVGIVPNKILEYFMEYYRERRPGDPDPGQEREVPGKGRYEVEDHLVHRFAPTRVLFLRRVYPINVRRIELKGRVKVDIRGTVTIQTFNAHKPVITLRGNWFHHVEDAIRGAVADWARNKTLDDFTEEEKGRNGSELERAILKTQKTKSGTIATTGMGVVAFNFGDWEESIDPEVQAASRGEELEKLKAKAKIAAAEGDAKAIKIVGEANAEAAEKLVKAAGSDPVGARNLAVRDLSGAIEKHNGTLVLGGQTPLLSIDDKSTPTT